MKRNRKIKPILWRKIHQTSFRMDLGIRIRRQGYQSSYCNYLSACSGSYVESGKIQTDQIKFLKMKTKILENEKYAQ